jgi:cation diffusion facilitator family transporter
MQETVQKDDEAIDAAQQARASRTSTLVSVAVNICLSAAQVGGGLLSGSQGLVADGIHSLSDLIADFAVLFAGWYSHKAADTDHPYGHQRSENAASLFLGVLLVAVGAGMLYAAVIKLESPETIAQVSRLALWIAVVALVAKELLFRYMMAIALRAKSTLLAANAWHARSDAASSLVVGLGIIGNLMGYTLLDPVAALIVGLLICRMGWGFAYEALHDLMDRAADEDESTRILQTILGVAGVQGAHGLRTRKMGDMLIVDVHIEVDAGKTVREGHDIALLARDEVLAKHHVLDVMTHVDPV